MLHVYHGDGKGKTTAAFGMALRFLGHQKKVLVLQFLKDGKSGEMRSLKQLSNVDLYAENLPQTFFYQMSDEEKRECKEAQHKLFHIAEETVTNYDCIIMDEILDAVELGLFSEEEILSFLEYFRMHIEIIVTGREASVNLRKRADYDMEIISHKHPYENGIQAREGIEY